MDKSKNFIVKTIIAIVIVIIIIIGIILLIQKRKIDTDDVKYEYPDEIFTIEVLKDASEFYTIENITSQYINATIYDEREKICSMIGKEYIQQNNINAENINDKIVFNSLGEINQFDEIEVVLNRIYKIQKSYRISSYFVSGYVKKNKESEERNSIEIIVEIDNQNNTFQILPYEYIIEKGYTDIHEGNTIQIDTEEIPTNSYNTFEYQVVTDEIIVWDYINSYKDNILYGDVKKSYELLEKDYREKRFGSLEGYQSYIQNNIIQIIKSSIESYKVTNLGDKTEYICIDQYGNYYIFIENAIMDFEVILDTYTIDLPEFIEKYEGATDQQKVALNIEKFIQSINAKDYKYAYGCLADSFKNNYFKTQEEFEDYAKNNFFDNNTVGYKEFSTQGDVYTYAVILTNKVTGEQKNKTFIMQLGKETDFVMSFDR